MATDSRAGDQRSSRDWLPGTLRQMILAVSWLTVTALCLLASVSFVIWQLELREIRELVAPEIDENAPEQEIIVAAREFLRDDVGYQRTDAYFLAPAFSFMRPTALQVIRHGGDCAYRTRAFIVVMRLFGIQASKLALYNSEGVPVHAVAQVETAAGPYYVDLLFNLVHENDDGEALSLAELANKETLAASVERAVAGGNARAARYPLDEYTFDDVRTINWNKNVALESIYGALVSVLGDERAREVPRPYLSEEPALMVIVLSTGATVPVLILLWVVRRRGRGAPREAV